MLYLFIQLCPETSDFHTKAFSAANVIHKKIRKKTNFTTEKNGNKRTHATHECNKIQNGFYTYVIQPNILDFAIYTSIVCNGCYLRVTKQYNKKKPSQYQVLLIRMSLVRVQLPEPKFPQKSADFLYFCHGNLFRY